MLQYSLCPDKVWLEQQNSRLRGARQWVEEACAVASLSFPALKGATHLNHSRALSI